MWHFYFAIVFPVSSLVEQKVTNQSQVRNKKQHFMFYLAKESFKPIIIINKKFQRWPPLAQHHVEHQKVKAHVGSQIRLDVTSGRGNGWRSHPLLSLSPSPSPLPLPPLSPSSVLKAGGGRASPH